MGNVIAAGVVGVGYARALFSARARGHVVSVDLVRVVLRSAGRLAMRRRVAAEFAGYLVTDAGPVAVLPAFSKSRDRYLRMFEAWSLGRTGFSVGDDGGGDLDAPGWVPAGSVRAVSGRLVERRAYPVYLARDEVLS